VLFVLIAFSLLGGARIFLFIFNRVILGNHRQERSYWKWLLYATPPLLGALMLFFRPVHFVTAIIGLYWIARRAHALRVGAESVAGANPFRNNVYDLEVTRHEVEIANLPLSFDGYRIAFLTDTHVAPFMRRAFYREVVAQALHFEPDLILLGGDFVTWERHIPLMAELLLPDLAARDGVYAVLGNHDYWSNPDGVVAAMTARGVRFLINRSIDIRRGDDTIALAGIDEVYRGEPDADAALARLDPQMPRIAISHHPDIIDLLDDRRIDLLLCGHTHGGQIRFPFFGAVVVPSKHEARYASGFHRVANVLLYVSRGIGAVPPLRILCKPEVATFILRPSSHAHETVGSLAGD
jgi:predicted MPP superfamily phosphohydrolase